jgi:hypothetical protein
LPLVQELEFMVASSPRFPTFRLTANHKREGCRFVNHSYYPVVSSLPNPSPRCRFARGRAVLSDWESKVPRQHHSRHTTTMYLPSVNQDDPCSRDKRAPSPIQVGRKPVVCMSWSEPADPAIICNSHNCCTKKLRQTVGKTKTSTIVLMF